MSQHSRRLRVANEWVEIGNLLAKSTSEGHRRVAASRLYYALYHRAIAAFDDKKTISHKSVGHEYHRRYETGQDGLGGLRGLHQLRCLADYSFHIEFSNEDLAYAILLAQGIEANLLPLLED